MIDKFKVLGQPMTSELGLITQNSEKCDFADTSFMSRLESRFKDQNVSCGR